MSGYNKVVYFYFQLSSVLAGTLTCTDTTHDLSTILTVSNDNLNLLAIQVSANVF